MQPGNSCQTRPETISPLASQPDGDQKIKVFLIRVTGVQNNFEMSFLVVCRSPRPVGVVMWTGYAGPEWAWPKAHS
ncbi:MAG: hypothetical protein P8175_04415, partial [Deltaproteobacteria bacterium]